MQLCTVFNQHHSKEWPCFVDGKELDSVYTESYFRGVTHSDARSASDTERSNAVNSPRAPCSWLLYCQRHSCLMAPSENS